MYLLTGGNLSLTSEAGMVYQNSFIYAMLFLFMSAEVPKARSKISSQGTSIVSYTGSSRKGLKELYNSRYSLGKDSQSYS